MKICLSFLIFGFIQLKIQFEWTKDTLARRPSDLAYKDLIQIIQGQNDPFFGEFSKNAFAIVNLLAPSDLVVDLQMLNINVNAKIDNEITKESANCICNAIQGNGFLLCDFKNIKKEIDSIQILDNKENDEIEFNLKDFNTLVEICNGIHGDNNNNNNDNSITKNITNKNDKENENNLSKGAIAGITISSIVVIGGTIFISYKIINNNKIEEKTIKINQNIKTEKSENININEKNMDSNIETKGEDIKDENIESPNDINQDNTKKIIEFLESKVGCGYAYGSEGQTLTESLLNNFKSQYKDHVKDGTEKWLGKECYDCSGLVMKALEQVGIKVHHNAESTWAEDLKQRGDIKDMPKDKLCLVFRSKNGKMAHIGIYLGNGKVIEAKGADKGVVESDFEPKIWTHWGVPSGLE